jgi:lactate 2-monooxygenase
MLRPTSTRDLRVSLFGTTYDTPLLIAPVGVQGIFHADKETGMASVATELGVP